MSEDKQTKKEQREHYSFFLPFRCKYLDAKQKSLVH